MTSEFYLNSVSVIKFFSTQAHVCYYRVSNGGKNATREVAAYTLEVACFSKPQITSSYITCWGGWQQNEIFKHNTVTKTCL